jgi:hypothetical protein
MVVEQGAILAIASREGPLMAIQVTPTKIQKMEFEVMAVEEPCRVTVVTGTIVHQIGALNDGIQTVSLIALVDPKLTPGQFRKATATAAISQTSQKIFPTGSGPPSTVKLTVDDVQASLDDESGKIELRIDASVTVANAIAAIEALNFQVTTLAKL